MPARLHAMPNQPNRVKYSVYAGIDRSMRGVPKKVGQASGLSWAFTGAGIADFQSAVLAGLSLALHIEFAP
jgi:hypothetical protein